MKQIFIKNDTVNNSNIPNKKGREEIFLALFFAPIFAILLLFLVSLIPYKIIEKHVYTDETFINVRNNPSSFFASPTPPISLGEAPEGIDMHSLNGYRIDELTNSEMIALSAELKPSIKILNPNFYTKSELVPVEMPYGRYWHGYAILIRPLLVFFTASRISDIIYFITIFCAIMLACVLFIKKYVSEGVLFCISLLTIRFATAASSPQYAFIFIIALLSSIFFLVSNQAQKHAPLLFFIIGFISCFIDLLTCETITLTLPLTIFIAKNKKDLKNILPLPLLWIIGYSWGFLSKWSITKIFFKENLHIDKSINWIISPFEARIAAIIENLMLLPYAMGIIIPVAGVLMLISLIIFYKKAPILMVIFLIYIIPFIRFFILSEHSLYHSFFTYRALIACPVLFDVFFKNIRYSLKNSSNPL